MFTRIILILLFIFPIFNFKKPDPLSIPSIQCEYNFTSPCILSNLSFINENSFKKPISLLIEDINEYIDSSYMFKSKFILKKDSQNPNISDFRLIMRDDIKENETMTVFFNEEEVLHSGSIGRAYFNRYPEIDDHIEFPKLKIEDDDTMLAFILLFHIYNIEYSKFKYDITLMIRNYALPLITMTDYEISLLRKEYLKDLIIHSRKAASMKYDQLIDELEKKWSKTQILSVLKGREKIPYQDFLFSWILVQSKAWAVSGSGKGKGIRMFIIPVYNHLKFKDDLTKSNAFLKKQMTGRDLLSTKILANKDLNEGDELYMDILESHPNQLFIYSGQVTKTDHDCIRIRVMPEYVAKDWMKNISNGESCFGRNGKELKNYQIVALNMNFKDEEKDQCAQIMKRYKDLSIEERQDAVINKCPFSGFDQIDFLNTTINDIENEVRPELERKVKKAEEYLELRKEKKLDFSNAELIRKYWIEKVGLLDDVKETFVRARNFSLERAKKEKAKKKQKNQKEEKINKKSDNNNLYDKKTEF